MVNKGIKKSRVITLFTLSLCCFCFTPTECSRKEFPKLQDRTELCGFTSLFYTPDREHCKQVIISSIFGNLTIEEPVLIEVLQHPQFKRLSKIRQHGHWYYLCQNDSYTRYEHSVNVFVIVRMFGGSIEEQVSALLHDISHTVFSHVGAYYFSDHYRTADSYQDDTHESFLKAHGFEALLKKYNLTIASIHHQNKTFTILEQKLPDLCADRIEYNITGGLYKGIINKEEARALIAAIRYENGHWYFINTEAAERFSEISLKLTEFLWGGAVDNLSTLWLAQSLRRAVATGILTQEMVCNATDDTVWEILCKSTDPLIVDRLYRMKNSWDYFALDDAAYDTIIYGKFRGTDPLVLHNDGSFKRLTEIDSNYNTEFERVKACIKNGWHIRFTKVSQWAADN
ncbi:MAG: hypothetical protein UV38_C0003G0091 [candidate division TM6 bacterium GW2011_GWE2_42_60]|nr:MAG: hypothetical protein UV38_C0003G0091 [candidate division TM6 bacterium GW2011_GWE2_42_60]